MEVAERSERRIDRSVTSRLAPDCPRAAGRIRATVESVARTLAIGVANRVDRRQIHNVKTQIAQLGQAMLGLLKRAWLSRIAGLRAHEHLVPGSEARFSA